MKATDLMLGDWVIYFGVPSTILEITRDYILIDEGGPEETMASINDIKPIPITPEILEKNGFNKNDDTGWWLADDYYDVHIYEWSDSIWVARYESNEMHCPHEQLTMGYIHELQHFLKAVAIEEEIII